MSNRTQLTFNQEYEVDLFGEGLDTVKIKRRPWGIFEIFSVEAKQGKFRHQRHAMITAWPDTTGLAAVYTPDGGSALYLAGQAHITGDAYISARKFTSGFVAGRDFEGKKYNTGKVFTSKRDMPLLDTLLLFKMKQVREGNPDTYPEVMVDNLLETHRSFNQPMARYYYSEQSITLDDSLSGNTIVQSLIKITVSARAHLNDVILIAPRIELEDQFTGSVQCFASEVISVGKESRLKYPSALVLLREVDQQDSIIVLKQGAVMHGAVLIEGYNTSYGSSARLEIQKGALLHGMAYINASADIRGEVSGNVITRFFQVNMNGMYYTNHILDGNINANKRSVDMPATLLWSNNKRYAVAKWLN